MTDCKINKKTRLCKICGRYLDTRFPIDSKRKCIKEIKKPKRRNNLKSSPQTIEQQIGQGPGTELKKLIPGFLEHKGCGCKDFAKLMNTWGPEKCRENKQQIVDRLVSESKKRFGLNLVPKILTAIVAEQMVDNAIKNYEEKIDNGQT